MREHVDHARDAVRQLPLEELTKPVAQHWRWLLVERRVQVPPHRLALRPEGRSPVCTERGQGAGEMFRRGLEALVERQRKSPSARWRLAVNAESKRVGVGRTFTLQLSVNLV